MHFSTIQTVALFFYLLTVNMQAGGLKGVRQLAGQIKRDLITNGKEAELAVIFLVFFWSAPARASTRRAFGRIRERYAEYASVDPMRGACFSALFAFAATYAFELIWVPFYDYFQFGSVFWPIFRSLDPTGNPFLSQDFLRDSSIVGICLGLGLPMLYLVWDTVEGRELRRFEIKWRLGWRYGLVLALAAASWVAWIYFPHRPFDVSALTPSSVLGLQGVTQKQLEYGAWIWPRMGLFPQTEYTFYPASSFLQNLRSDQIFGFYVQSWGVHAANVLTKYFTFLAVCYPALLKVKRNADI